MQPLVPSRRRARLRIPPKACLDTDVTIVETIGYAAGSDVPVFSKTYATVGTFSPTGSVANTPLFVAGLVRYSTTARTSKNHPVYLFNYYHRALVIPGAEQETLNASWKSALDTYAAAWITGFSDGTHTCVRAGPNGATATGHQVAPYATHRDFPN
jgi:hypothetical protein